MVSTGDLSTDEAESLLRRRRNCEERRDSSVAPDETEHVGRRPLKLELGDYDLRKRRISNVTYSDELKVNVDDIEKETKPLEKDKNESLLSMKKIGWFEMLWMELTRFVLLLIRGKSNCI